MDPFIATLITQLLVAVMKAWAEAKAIHKMDDEQARAYLAALMADFQDRNVDQLPRPWEDKTPKPDL